MAALTRSAVVRVSRGSLAAALIAVVSCGGERPTPTSPVPTPSIPVTVSVAPNPLTATIVRCDGGTVTFRIAADITLSASTATGAQIDRVTTTVSYTQQTGGTVLSLFISHSVSVSLQAPPSGTLMYAHTEQFGSGTGEVTWRIEFSGTDGQGRPFTASSGNVRVEIATSAASGSG